MSIVIFNLMRMDSRMVRSHTTSASIRKARYLPTRSIQVENIHHPCHLTAIHCSPRGANCQHAFPKHTQSCSHPASFPRARHLPISLTSHTTQSHAPVVQAKSWQPGMQSGRRQSRQPRRQSSQRRQVTAVLTLQLHTQQGTLNRAVSHTHRAGGHNTLWSLEPNRHSPSLTIIIHQNPI